MPFRSIYGLYPYSFTPFNKHINISKEQPNILDYNQGWVLPTLSFKCLIVSVSFTPLNTPLNLSKAKPDILHHYTTNLFNRSTYFWGIFTPHRITDITHKHTPTNGHLLIKSDET